MTKKRIGYKVCYLLAHISESEIKYITQIHEKNNVMTLFFSDGREAEWQPHNKNKFYFRKGKDNDNI